MFNPFTTFLLLVFMYWLYYRKFVLENPNKSNDRWF